MLKSIKFHYKLRTLIARSRKIEIGNQAKIKKAIENKENPNEIEGLAQLAYHDHREFDELIREQMTSYLCDRARSMILPLPDDSKDWDEGYLYNKRILTDHGIAKLRTAIRKDVSERLHLLTVPISLAIGLTGTIIGILGLCL